MNLLARLLARLRPKSAVAFEDGDDATLDALREAGADLSLETETRFYLYFPTEGSARQAARVATTEGYVALVQAPLEGYANWLCLLTRTLVPSSVEIKAARARLEELATSLHGEFDGWEAAVKS